METTNTNNEKPFVDFGRKTMYSLKKAMGTTSSMIPILKSRGQTHFAISDYGEVSGWVNQYFECIKNNITPILGMQVYVNNYKFETKDDVVYIDKHGADESWLKPASEVSDDEKDYAQIDFPIDLFAANIDGYYNVIKIHNDSQRNASARRPVTSDGFLKTHTGGVVALLPSPYSELSSLVYNGLKARAIACIGRYRSMFDDVYVEVSILEDEEYREINKAVVGFCLEQSIKMVPVINSHYDTSDDAGVFPTFQKCGRLRGGFAYEADYAPNMHYKSADEVWDTFKQFHQSDVFTEEVFQMMCFELDKLLGRFKTVEIDTSPKMPKFPDSDKTLRRLAFEGLAKKKLDDRREYVDRVEHELDNIIRAGFADYFIMLAELFDWYRREKDCITQIGRGSAGGSLVLYCIGVTKIDPVKHHLLFERFLDASRLDEIINRGGKISGADFPDVDCFTLDTLVLTDKGMRKIGELNIGDCVVTRDGSINKIEKIADHKNLPVVRVCYGDWYFDCTLNHRLLVKRNNEVDYKYVCELQRGDELVEDENTFLPIVEICKLQDAMMVRDLKIEDKHCFRVCGKRFDKGMQDVHNAGVVVHNCDFSSATKDSIKDYFEQKYGDGCICSIGTVGFLRTKSVLKELGRVHDVPADEINELTTVGMASLSPDDEELPLGELREKFAALNIFLEKHPLFEKSFSKLQGTINCWGVHAGGILVSDKPLHDMLPVRVNNGKLCTVWTEGINDRELGKMGFIKLDILAIETLDIIDEAIKLINQRHNVDLDFDSIPLDEPSALARLENNNIGVFQFETPLSLRVAKNMGGIKRFEDLASLSTLMRPAALENKFDVKFGEYRYGEDNPHDKDAKKPFIMDVMKPYIQKEYGLPIYQEAAYYFAKHLAGFDNVEAYRMMKLLYKNKMTKDVQPIWKEKFIEGCVRNVDMHADENKLNSTN